MTLEEQRRLWELVQNPPPGSKIAAAKEYGIDLTLCLRRLQLTPTERAEGDESGARIRAGAKTGRGRGWKESVRSNAEIAFREPSEVHYCRQLRCAIARGRFFSQELEIHYESSQENIEKLSKALSSIHPRLRGAPDDPRFSLETHSLADQVNFGLQTDLGDLNLIGESPDSQFHQLLKDAVAFKVFGGSYRVASLTDLIRSKRAAGRAKDLSILPELEALEELKAAQQEANKTRNNGIAGIARNRRHRAASEKQNLTTETREKPKKTLDPVFTDSD